MKINSVNSGPRFGMAKLNNSIVPIKTIETTKNAINNETILLSNFIEKVKSIINIITNSKNNPILIRKSKTHPESTIFKPAEVEY